MENGNTDADTTTPDTANDYFGYEATATQPTEGETGADDKIDYQAEVNRLLKETKVTDDGKFEFPANTPPWAKVAISNEKKFRDTQSGFTKATQDLKVASAEIDVLKGKLSSGLTAEQTQELNELKVTDVDAYFNKRTQYEAEAHTAFNVELEEVSTKTRGEIEKDRRTQYLVDFNLGRKTPITNELISSEVPSKYYAQLEKGEVTFEKFLSNVASFIDTPKVLANTDIETVVTNLSDVAGGDTPSAEKRFVNLELEYSKTVF